MTDSEFAMKVGSTRQQFSNWKNNGVNVPDKYIIRAIEQFPEVNARWLITGTQGEESEKIKTFEEYKAEFAKSYKEIIELKDRIIEDKEMIIEMLKETQK